MSARKIIRLLIVLLSGASIPAWAQAYNVPAASDVASIAPMALNSMASPPDKIAIAKVVDQQGAPVGTVQKVELDGGGKPLKVDIALMGGDRVITLDAAHLSYDAGANLLTASLDRQQLAALPPKPGG
jgi:hypothetical protein